MSPPLTEVQRYGASVIRCSKHSNAIEIRDRTTFDFYTGLPHMVLIQTSLSEPHASELNGGLEGISVYRMEIIVNQYTCRSHPN